MTKQPWQDVPLVKRKLRALGYGPQVWSTQPDGVESSLYRQMLKDFQNNEGLAVDGICGPKTWARLDLLTGFPHPEERRLRAEICALADILAAAGYREPKGRNNRGEPFDTWNRSAGVALGSPYCVSIWHHELGNLFTRLHARLPLRIGASTSALAAAAKRLGRLRPLAQAQPGDLILFRNALGKYFHAGLITATRGDTYETVEGNTLPLKRIIGEGGGVYARSRYKPRGMAVDLCGP